MLADLFQFAALGAEAAHGGAVRGTGGSGAGGGAELGEATRGLGLQLVGQVVENTRAVLH